MGKQHYPRPVRNANRSKNTTESRRAGSCVGELDRVDSRVSARDAYRAVGEVRAVTQATRCV